MIVGIWRVQSLELSAFNSKHHPAEAGAEVVGRKSDCAAAKASSPRFGRSECRGMGSQWCKIETALIILGCGARGNTLAVTINKNQTSFVLLWFLQIALQE